MIFIMLSKEDSEQQKNIIKFIKEKIKYNNINYHIIYNPKHIFENTLVDINHSLDIVLWHPKVAYNNLEIVKQFKNSIVILERPSLLIQKVSEHNPINENTAINHGFYLIYINPERDDITNNEWRLVVQEENYLMDVERLLTLIKKDDDNTKNTEIVIQDVFDDIINFSKNQINLS